MSTTVHFESSSRIIGGVNIAEATQSTNRLVFDESYTVIGNKLKASSIYAVYDLTIIGDIEAEEVEVGGTLSITGDIKANRILCNKSIICNGDIDAETVSGSEITANNITCKELHSTTNVIARMTIDVSESLEAEQSVVSGEGIVGNGVFSAQNAVAVDYFEFDGTVEGKVMEMATDDVFGEPKIEPAVDVDAMTIEEMIQLMKKKISIGLESAGEVDEEELLAFIKKISDGDSARRCDWEKIVTRLVELSYSNEIKNLADYLTVVFAKEVLPKEVIEYETIEHVFKKMLPEAEKQLDSIDYKARNLDEFALSLIIADICQEDIKLEKIDMIDRIFQSIGIKYKTVTNYIG